jgi:integrase
MNMPLKSLTQEAVQRAINKMAKTHSPKSVQNAHGLLSAAVATYYPQFVLRTTLPQKQKKEASIPTPEEINMILNAAKGTEMELPLYLAIWLGLRMSEIRGLTWDSIEGDYLHIKQALVDGVDGPEKKGTKTYSGNRKIKLPKVIADLIEAKPREDDFIIHLSGQAIYKRFTRLCSKVGVPHYRFHDLRHVNASVMLAIGVPDKYSMQRMGHATNNMLKTVYQHTMDAKSAEVDAAIDAYFENLLAPK